jgi:hypothetical protein
MRTASDLGHGCGFLAAAFLLPCLVLLPGLATPPACAQEPDPRYWRLAEIAAAFDAWSAAYPDIFHQTSLGESGQGTPILMARISDHASLNEAEPAIIFHAAQHANECNGTGAVMRQMATLLEGYGSDPAVTARVDGLELWFIPVLNPDGHGYVFSGAASWDQWRKTLRDNNQNGLVDFPYDGVDLNRNWDWFWQENENDQPSDDYYKGPMPWSEAEALVLRMFVPAKRPVLVVDYHSPATINWASYIFYPWVSTHGWGESPDFEIAQALANGWATATRDEANQPYHSIYGYDTLPKEQNWIYGRTGILTFEMEISDHCWWTGATVDTIAARVARGSTYVLDRVLNGPGIRGRVTDATTGQPLVAEVQIAELHSPEVGPRFSEAHFGQFYRLTATGDYTVIVSRRDYLPETHTVTVSANAWTTVDVALLPATAVVGDEPCAAAGPELYTTNPVQAGQAVRLTAPRSMPPVQVELYDLRGRRLAVLGWGLAPGRDHVLRLPDRLSGGVYLLRARAGDRQQVMRLVCVD